jgi:hypothetical protein
VHDVVTKIQEQQSIIGHEANEANYRKLVLHLATPIHQTATSIGLGYGAVWEITLYNGLRSLSRLEDFFS